MSRKTNKLKARLRFVEDKLIKELRHHVALVNDNARLRKELEREAALTIKLDDMPMGVHQWGKHCRIDFVLDAFELDYMRRGGSFYYNVNGYAQHIGRVLGDKVRKVIEDYIAGRLEIPQDVKR